MGYINNMLSIDWLVAGDVLISWTLLEAHSMAVPFFIKFMGPVCSHVCVRVWECVYV